MVIGTDIKKGMILPVPPFDPFLFGTHFAGIGYVLPLFYSLPLFYLRKQPAARYDGVGLKVFKGTGGTHFRGNDTDQVIFQGKYIHSANHAIFRDQDERSAKTLVFLAFPMKLNTDDHIFQNKRCIIILRFKYKPLTYLIM